MAGTQSIRRRSGDENEESMPLISPDSTQPSNNQEILKDSLSYISATILMFFLISIGIALALIPIFTVAAKQETNLMYRFIAIKIVRNIYSTLVSLTLIWFVRNKQKWVNQGYVWWPNQSRHLNRSSGNRPSNIAPEEVPPYASGHSSLFRPVLILGILSAVMDVMSIILDLQCLITQGVQPLKDTRVMDLLNDIVYLILVITQLLFFYVYDGAVFSGRRVFHYAMAIYIGSNIWAWVGVTVAGPYWNHFGFDFDPYENETHFCNHKVSKAIYRLNSAKQSLGIVFPEYSTMAITIMLSYWSAMTSVSADRRSDESHDVNNDFDNSGQLECSDQCVKNNQKVGQNRNIILLSFRKHYLVTLFSFVTIVSFFALNIVTQYDGPPGDWAGDNMELASIISGLFSIAIIVTTACLIVQCHRRVESNYFHHEASLGSSDYLLVFAATWSFLYDIIQFTASVDRIRSGTVYLGVVGLLLSICFTIETSLQTRFFLTIQRVDVSKVRSPEFIRACIIPILIMNAGYWVIIALAHEWADGGIFAPIVSMSFDGDDVKIGSIVILTVFPMVSLFRFHSTFICFEILKMTQHCEQPRLLIDESEPTADENHENQI